MNGIDLLESFVALTAISRAVLEEVIPPELLDQSDYLLTVVNSV